MPKIGSVAFYARWFGTLRAPFAGGSYAGGAAGRTYLGPIEIPWPIIIDRIGYQVGSTSAGNVVLGLYREGDTADSAEGGALVVETSSAAQPAASNFHVVTVSDTLLVPGLYFAVIEFSDATGTFQRNYDAAQTYYRYYNRVGGYGALTDPCPSLTTFSVGPRMFVRVKTNLPLSLYL